MPAHGTIIIVEHPADKHPINIRGKRKTVGSFEDIKWSQYTIPDRPRPSRFRKIVSKLLCH